MKRFLFCLAILLSVGGFGQWQAVHAQTENVTFILNTATVPDTLPVTGATIQIRGGLVNAGTSPITWGGDSVNNMTNIGGDYWTKTLQLNAGDTLKYKFVVNYPGNTGWEQNTTPPYPGLPADNRYFIVPTHSDTTVPVEFWANKNNLQQYFKPYADHGPDTMMVYFRVSMLGPINSGSFGFNNNTDTVGVRGGGPAGGDLNWAPTYYLTKESPAVNGAGYTVPASSFWSGGLRFPKAGLTAGTSIGYKFLIGFDWGRDEYQGGHANRSFPVPVGLKDTTLQWVFYNDERPSGRANPDTTLVTFIVNMAKAVGTGGFTIGDTLYVRSGYFGTAAEASRRVQLENLIGTLYEGTDTIVTKVGNVLDYQYYHLKNGQEIRENFYNFYYTGDQSSEAEKRQVLVPGLTYNIIDTATSITQPRRMPDFPNARTLNQPVTVKYELNLKPVFYQLKAGDSLTDIQGSFNIAPRDMDSLLTWGVWINGPAVGGWSNTTGTDWDFGLNSNPDKRMWDDGTHGDVTPGDSIFTITVQDAPDSILVGSKGQIGQTFKFGVRGGDNEGGHGGYGNNHNENISDLASTYKLHSQFGSINPAFYSAWDYDNERPSGVTGVKSKPGSPRVFSLGQNYPNPFNPATTIDYSIPSAGIVTLRIYNVLGQEVATLVNTRQEAGAYHAKFDASRFTSGVYFYRLTAGSNVSTKRMLLVK